MLCIIVGKPLGIQNTLIEVPNVVDQTAAACAFSVANVESAFIVEFFAVQCTGNREVCFLIPTGMKLRITAFCMLLFVQKFQYRIGQGKAGIWIGFDKVRKQAALCKPFLVPYHGHRIGHRFFFRQNLVIILHICNGSKSFFRLLLIFQNGIESLFHAVFLNGIALPVCHFCIIKSLYQMFCRRIRCQCRKSVPQIVYGTSLYNILILAFSKRKNGISHGFIGNRFPCIAIDRSQFRFAKCRRKRLVVLPFKSSLYAKQSDCQFLSYIFALLHSSGKSVEFRLSQTVAVDAFFTGRKFVQIAILKKDIAEALDLIPGKRSLCQIRCQILLQKCLFLIGQRDLLLWLLLVNGVLQGFGKTIEPAGKYPFA